jgi:ISXO2-like transposase domain
LAWQAESPRKATNRRNLQRAIGRSRRTTLFEANKHEHKKLKAGRGSVGKTAILGMHERGGRTVATPIESTDKETVQAAIHQHVEIGSTLHTDEAGAYADIGGFCHDAVNLADNPEREAHQDRRERRQPRPLCRLPDGRGRHSQNAVLRYPAAGLGAAAATGGRIDVKRSIVLRSIKNQRRDASG